jgi:hypothetical protein
MSVTEFPNESMADMLNVEDNPAVATEITGLSA